jgi:osmotically-inducible protein OsmY
MSDIGVQHAVTRELEWDTRVEANEIGVTVDRGVVTLTGNVDTFAHKRAAEEAAHRVAGVLDVANDIVVRPAAPTGGVTDAGLARAVRHALQWDAFVPEERITSTVDNGWVTLEGSVRVLRERRDAEHAVERLAAVRGVTNRIVVEGPQANAAAIGKAIEEALERAAHREAEHIHVGVRDGVVTLDGVVRSWAEKRAVLGVAAHARGVLGVDDRLTVRPPEA